MNTPGSNLSGVVAGGQTLNFNAGAGAITNGALVQIGGPGNEAWPVVTVDHAALASQQVVAPVSLNNGGAANNYARWESATDILGSIYVLTPNTSSQGVNVTKIAPGGTIGTTSTVLDSTAHAMVSIRLLSLSNSTFAAVYVDSTTGGVRFVIFDAGLAIIAGPTAVATGYVSGAVAYMDACPLSGGGFAVVYANSGHTAINLQTYTNTGSAGLAATNIQTTGGSASLTYLKMAQLSSGNLAVMMRQTATPAGTSFVIVTTGGASVTTNTVVDATATLGFLSMSVLSGGGFAVAVMNGTNIIAAAYSAVGVLQGSAYSAANTLNNTTYSQFQISNDGTNFYLFYIQTSGGLAVVQLTPTGTSSVSATGLLSSTFTSTSSLAAAISNNMAIVAQASVTTGGQKYVTLGLPDTSLGAVEPYVITGATTIGSAAGTTGCYWPSLHALGDFTAIFIYDQQTTANVFASVIKFAASTIQGVAQNSAAAYASVTVNPGPGSYPANSMAGTNGLTFDHSTTGGNRGVLYMAGVTLSNPASAAVGPAAGTTFVTVIGPSSSYVYTPLTNVLVTVSVSSGTAQNGAVTINGFGIDSAAGQTQTLSFAAGAGQSITIAAAASAGAMVSAQRIN